MRVKKRFILDIDQKGFSLKSVKCVNVDVDISGGITEELMNLVYTDPDVADLIKLGVKKYVLAYIA